MSYRGNEVQRIKELVNRDLGLAWGRVKRLAEFEENREERLKKMSSKIRKLMKENRELKSQLTELQEQIDNDN